VKNIFGEIAVLFSYPKHLVFFIARLVIAYGFAMPALLKLNDMTATAKWFESISIPFPIFTAYLVSGLETIGIVLLILGFFTRQISIMLALIMIGAMLFVHAPNGFSVADNGIEIPLYYLSFLLLFATFGAGKYSLDSLIFKDGNHE